MNLSPSFELHEFCDASSRAYAVVVYIKTFNPVTVRLVAAKTKTALINATTLSRLELSSAVLLLNLMQLVKDALPDSAHKTLMWCNDPITLSWFSNPPTEINQFVLHRAK